MKVYVASKFERKEEVRALIREIRRQRHTVVGDWTSHTIEGEEPKHVKSMLRAFAVEDYDSVKACNVFVLIHDDNCRGGFVELGVALGHSSVVRYVCVVGGEGKSPTSGPIFYDHPHVKHFRTTGEFLAWLNGMSRDGL